jgi:signal transduction histidine kinase
MVLGCAAVGTTRDVPASRLKSQAILAYGVGLAGAVQLAVMHSYLLQSWSDLVIFPIASLAFSTATVLLWQLVFPRLQGLQRGQRLVLQSAIALLAMGLTSLFVVDLVREAMVGKSVFNVYDGGDVRVTIPAALIRIAPLIYILIPIIPGAIMTVVGFNQSWWQMFLLEAREHQARELAASAQLDALRARINPHFLFNSLNSIAQLISVDPDRAEACVERLAEVFRYLLHSDGRQFVTLNDELEIADAYLDIERARFGDRLKVDVLADEAARCRVVPTLILQPLVENAVKHGVAAKVGGGSVRIEAGIENGDLRVVVRDTGLGMRDGPAAALSGGVGLRNVHDRLVQLYGERYAPQIDSAPGEGTSITVRVPQFRDVGGGKLVH